MRQAEGVSHTPLSSDSKRFRVSAGRLRGYSGIIISFLLLQTSSSFKHIQSLQRLSAVVLVSDITPVLDEEGLVAQQLPASWSQGAHHFYQSSCSSSRHWLVGVLVVLGFRLKELVYRIELLNCELSLVR